MRVRYPIPVSGCWLPRKQEFKAAMRGASRIPLYDFCCGHMSLVNYSRREAGQATRVVEGELAISQGDRLSLAAIWPNSGSERAFNFRMALLRWTFTVAWAIPISSAICLLRRPRAT